MPKTSITPTKKPSTPTKTPSTPNKTLSTPTKTPTMQSQSKEYDKKQILVYAVLSQGNFRREFRHIFGVPFAGLKNMLAYQK